MTRTRFTCSLTRADEPACQSYARVTIVDSEGATARGCPRHAVAALSDIAGVQVDWPDTKGLNEWERKAVELAEERSHLSICGNKDQNVKYVSGAHCNAPTERA
jgi:hypothetical protein